MWVLLPTQSRDSVNFVEARQGIRVILHKEGLVIYSTVLNCQYDGYPVTTLEADDGQ